MKDLSEAKALTMKVLSLDETERLTVATFALAHTLLVNTSPEYYDEFWYHLQVMVRDTMQDMVMEVLGVPIEEETKH